jgi:hypothetical protein
VTFTNLFEEFGGSWGYSVQSDVPFGAQSRIEPVLDALAAIGCLTKSSAGYVWTELMVPVRNATDDGWPYPTIGERA